MSFRKHLAAVLAISMVAGACASARSEQRAAIDNTVIPAESLEYANLNPAIAMAHAFGDRGKGAHGSFGTFPANFATPFHTHIGAYRAVVIEGQMTNPFDGEDNPPVMSPGSYWSVAAGATHATACVSDVPCKFFFWADGAFDFTPVK